jgi:hypothetical protein
MEEFIYLEVDEEITSIIDRIHKNSAKKFALVVPRGATVLQSIVNLKLINKEAEKLDKTIAIVTLDKIGRNLAAQVGLPVYDDVKQAAVTVVSGAKPEIPASDIIEIDASKEGKEGGAVAKEDVPEGINVHYYDQQNNAGAVATGAAASSGGTAKEEPRPEKSQAKEEKVAFKSREVKDSSSVKSMQQVMGGKKEDKKPRGKSKLKIILAIVATLLALVGVWLFVTRAQVKLTIPAEAYEAQAQVTVDATLIGNDLANQKIMGTLVEAEKDVTQSVKATGKKQVGEKATGTLSFYYSNDQVSKVLAAGSTVTSDGKKFTLNSAITVPGASIVNNAIVPGKADGVVTAQEPGAEFNMSEATNYTTSNSMITAKGATTGGTTKEVKIVTAADINDSKDKIIADTSPELRDAIKASAKGGYVIEGAINYGLVDFSASKNANDEAENFDVKAKIKVQVIAFSESDLRLAVAEQAKKNVPADKSILIDEKDVITPALVAIDLPKKEMKLKATLASHIGRAVDVSSLPSKIKGKSVKKARDIVIEQTAGKDTEISIRPNIGLLRLPFISKNIKINLEYVTAEQQP